MVLRAPAAGALCSLVARGGGESVQLLADPQEQQGWCMEGDGDVHSLVYSIAIQGTRTMYKVQGTMLYIVPGASYYCERDTQVYRGAALVSLLPLLSLTSLSLCVSASSFFILLL